MIAQRAARVTFASEHGPVAAIGLTFAGPLGLAAGIDRTGERLALLDLAGFGHIEIGTLTAGETLKIGSRPGHVRLGVSLGSARLGLNQDVVADYRAALHQAYDEADYLCVNLTSPRGGRDGNSNGVDFLLRELKCERDLCAAMTGRRKPLLVKLDGGDEPEKPPIAVAEARRLGFDGIVLVCRSLRRIAAIKAEAGRLTLISVGGVRTVEQARQRLAAGAALVQAHSAFVDAQE